MTQNVMSIPGEINGIIWGAVILALFAITVALRNSPRVLSGLRGYRKEQGEPDQQHEVIGPDGYIDSFAGEIEEGGGSLPPVLQVAVPGVLLWWLGYLILMWSK